MNLALSIRPSVCPSATVFSQEWLIFFYPKEDPFICGFLFKSFQNTYGQLFLMLLMFLTFQLFLHVEKRMYEHAKVYSNYKKKIYQTCLYINFTIFNANYELFSVMEIFSTHSTRFEDYPLYTAIWFNQLLLNYFTPMQRQTFKSRLPCVQASIC